MRRLFYILILFLLPAMVIAQDMQRKGSTIPFLNSSPFINLTKTNIRIESQYGSNPQIYSASQASYTRLSLESGIIGMGIIPLRIQAFYSTENQSLYQENFFRLSFDLNLLVEAQKANAQKELEKQNRKLVYLKRDFDKQKEVLKIKNRLNDSLIVQMQHKLKTNLKDTISNLKNSIRNKVQDSEESIQSNLSKLPDHPDFKDSVNDLKKKHQSKKNEYKKKYQDSLEKLSVFKKRLVNDSLLKRIDKVKKQKEDNEKQLQTMQDSIKKIESAVKKLLEIVKNPKSKIQDMVGKKIHLPKTFQVGRINPYFSESVFNGTPAKGMLLEFENARNSTTISFGKLSGFQESNSNELNFKSEYFAFKQGFKIKDLVIEAGIFNCYKSISQGNQIFVIPFANAAYTTKNGIILSGEFAKSIDYRITTFESRPEGKVNSGFTTNLASQIPFNQKAGMKLLVEKSSENYSTPGNPYFISGPLKFQAEYYQSLFKNKLKIDLGIRANANIKVNGKFQNQTLCLRLRSMFEKSLNFSISYLPIQSRSEFTNENMQVFLMQTNVLNLMTNWKKRFKGYFIMQNLGFWTKSQNGLAPDFESKNLFYSFSIVNSKNNKATFNFNAGTGHSNNDSLNQMSTRLLLEYGLKNKSILTGNYSYSKFNLYNTQQTYITGIKHKIGWCMLWIESGGQKTRQGKLSYLGKITMNFSF